MKYFSFGLATISLLIVVFSVVGFLPRTSLALTNPRDGLNTTADTAFGGNHSNVPLNDFDKNSLPAKIGSVVNFVLGFVGALFFGLIVYGGLLWMTARGNDKQIGDAKKIMTNAAIGLAIVMASYAITAFVITTLNKPATS